MSKGNTFETDLLALIFNATAIANIADNASSSPLTSLYISLHSGDPGEAGNQTTNETTYTNYARQAVPRSAAGSPPVSGFLVSGNTVYPGVDVDFPESGGSASDITYWAIGTAASGAGKILYKGTCTTTPVVSGTIPRVKTTSTVTED